MLDHHIYSTYQSGKLIGLKNDSFQKNLKAFAFFTLALVPSVAMADWKYQVSESEFDGTKSEGAYVYSESGRQGLSIWANRSGVIDMQAPSIVLNPNMGYLCNTSERDTQFVSWITFDKDGNKILEKHIQEFETDLKKEVIFVRKDSVLGEPYAKNLLNAMMNAAEIRFKFTDDCGNESVTKFKIDGLTDMIIKIKNTP